MEGGASELPPPLACREPAPTGVERYDAVGKSRVLILVEVEIGRGGGDIDALPVVRAGYRVKGFRSGVCRE
jgi:hypothetical protein